MKNTKIIFIAALVFIVLIVYIFIYGTRKIYTPDSFKQLSLKLENENIYLNVSTWGKSKILFLNLHENEQTSIEAAKEVLNKSGGILVELKSKGNRLISGKKNSKIYTFDPNRIFSSAGIKKTLKKYSSNDFRLKDEIEKFANDIIIKILTYNPILIIALHNNTRGGYSINTYKKGAEYENDVADIFINPQMNKDDFFYVIDQELFNLIKREKFNVVLQNNDKATDDGSLSIYCGRNGLKYINIEAQNGHKREQMQMIDFIINQFNK